jgi:hypothetical protein
MINDFDSLFYNNNKKTLSLLIATRTNPLIKTAYKKVEHILPEHAPDESHTQKSVPENTLGRP